MVRSQLLDALAERYDVVIIGGGITGLSILRESAARGLKTLLLEKNDFGWATSAATSKLIHGGLRYLENFEFGLVRESLRERRILGLSAPHLTRPLPILLPVYNYSKPGMLLFSVGLHLYDLLSFERNRDVPPNKRIPNIKKISPDEVKRIAPCLKPEGLKGGFIFYDLQSIHPERLSLAFLKSGVHAGGVAINHMAVEELIAAEVNGRKRVTGLKLKDTLSGKSHTVSGTVFINCTGPWMDLTLQQIHAPITAQLLRSQGIHLLTDTICDSGYAILHRNREGKHFFVLPWQNRSIIGPTDTPFEEHPDTLYPGFEDSMDLLHVVNDSLQKKIKIDQIRSIIIGIRPLIFSGKNTYRASRKSEIYDHAPFGLDGLISVAGGKWTTSRQLGEDVVKGYLIRKISALRGIRLRVPTFDSTRQPLFGAPGNFGSSEVPYIERSLTEYAMKGVTAEIHRHLIHLYGTEHTEILKLIEHEPRLAKRIAPGSDSLDIIAQIHFAVLFESAMTLEDVLNRRLVIGTYGYPGDAAVRLAAKEIAGLLKWNRSRLNEEIKHYRENYPTIDNVNRKSLS